MEENNLETPVVAVTPTAASPVDKDKKMRFILSLIVAFLLVVIIILVGILLTSDSKKNNDVTNENNENLNIDETENNTNLEEEIEEPSGKMIATEQSSKVTVANLVEGQTITSPFVVEGTAHLYFAEGEFLVEVYNNTDALIGYGSAIAQNQSWMDGEVTPFQGTLHFNNGAETEGKVIFKRANPSGLPENDESYTVNVKFAPQQVQVNDISNLLTNKLPNRVTITGSARAFYFEAQFQVELQDGNGNLIVRNFATAQGDWMVDEYVPFTVDITYVTPTDWTEGKLVFKKDNPSGLPENDLSYEIPVQF